MVYSDCLASELFPLKIWNNLSHKCFSVDYQCRWENQLKPDINHAAFDSEEDKIVIEVCPFSAR